MEKQLTDREEADALWMYIRCAFDENWKVSPEGAEQFLREVKGGFAHRRLDCGMTSCPLEGGKSNEAW